jgi:hypothetical protein
VAEPESPGELSFADFARRKGWKRHYVTQLKGEGRLVLSEDGKRVRVAESLARIEATRDPAKAGVATRHAAARAAGEGEAAPAPSSPASGAPGGQDGDDETPVTAGYAYWRERSEKAKALAGERDNLVAEGKLLDAADVEAQLAGAVTRLRASLEAMPYDLAPELAPITDEAQLRARLTTYIEHALAELARQFSALARRDPA